MRIFKHLGRLFKEIGAYALEQKAWWLIPLVVLLVILSVLILLGQAVSLPFIYTLF